MQCSTETPAITVFPSELDWMAAAWEGSLLARLTFGRSDPHQALADLGGGDVSEPSADQARFISRLQAYAKGRQIDFSDVPLAQNYLTDFGKRVIQHCRIIPYGQTLTYGELAEKAGSPRAARAVGNIMASNRTALVVPCHRVVGSSGSLGGYSAPEGVRMKLRLLEQEGCTTLSGR